MIDPVAKALAQAKNFAAFTTLFADGRPQTQMMWVDVSDEHVLINTEIHRAKYRNISRDPRVTVVVFDAENPYHYAEFRGRVTGEVHGSLARAHIDALSQKYHGTDYEGTITSERVILEITPDYVRVQ